MSTINKLIYTCIPYICICTHIYFCVHINILHHSYIYTFNHNFYYINMYIYVI